MATLLIDMPSGVAGDMLLGALLACGGDRERLQRDLLALGCGPIAITATPVMAGPLAAMRVEVDAEQEPRWQQPLAVDLRSARPATPGPAPAGQAALAGHAPGHDHRPYRLIRELIARAALPPRVVERAQRAFRLLAEAEAAVHGVDPETVEFHEVGSLDAIADVVGCCLLLEQLAIDRVIAGPILPGHGTVRCAHGLMPVPVPAVAEMLRRTGAPMRTLAETTGELTTPTGCALVCALADAFIGAGAAAADGRVLASGSGAGHKSIPGMANAVRCLVLEAAPTAPETVVEIATTIDDATGEDLALALAELLAGGALDAWLAPVVMKKGRPGHVLTVLARPADRDRLAALVLARTSSIGVRHRAWERQVLPRTEAVVEAAGARIRLKVVTLPDGSRRAKPEADDIAAAAAATGLPPAELRRLAQLAWRPT